MGAKSRCEAEKATLDSPAFALNTASNYTWGLAKKNRIPEGLETSKHVSKYTEEIPNLLLLDGQRF